MDGCLCWPTESADTNAVKLLPARQWKACWPVFAARPGEPHAALLPRLVQAANTQVLEAGMAATAAASHGDHAGELRSALRPRRWWRMWAIRAAI